jgi:hypothetical protein
MIEGKYGDLLQTWWCSNFVVSKSVPYENIGRLEAEAWREDQTPSASGRTPGKTVAIDQWIDMV